MKKYALTLSALTLAILSHSAMAAEGSITFTGAVSSKTCDLAPTVDGVNSLNVSFGTVEMNKTVEKDLVLKATVGDDCGSLTAGDTAMIAWGGDLNNNGLANSATGGGAASDAYVTLTPVNAKNNDPVKQGNDVTEFPGNVIDTDGAKFKAVLNGKNVAGKFSSTATFSVAYK